MKSLLLTFKEEWLRLIQKKTWPRRIVIPDIASKVVVLVGMRRTGKTTLLFQRIRDLIENGVDHSLILHVNFEDDRLHPITERTLAELVDTWYSMDPSRYDKMCYLFFDEIQNVISWEKTIRRLQDTKDVRICLTGSSAKLLSKEIATELRGRSFSVEVWPLDFEEHPGFETFPAKMGQSVNDRYLKAVEEYMLMGGFPETVDIDHATAVRILQEYVEVIVFRDVMERWNLGNLPLLRELVQRLLSMSGRLFSVNKFYNELKGRGFSVGKNTLYEYIGHIEDAYLVFLVPLFSQSRKKQNLNPRKVYAIDTGLLNSVNFLSENDRGFLFENMIFMALKRRGYRIYYYLTEERYEVDFLAESIRGDRLLVQACWNMTPENTRIREERALNTAMKRSGLTGWIVTPENYLEFIRYLDRQQV